MSVMTCASCGAGMPREFRFCGMCGARLPTTSGADVCGLCGAPAAPDGFECARCHAPLESARARMLGQERKVVTVVFGDLVGFTRRSSDRDPEEVKELVDRCFRRFTQVIESHGGYVDKYVGDGILALFGVPRTQEDDVDRALAGAVAMQEAIRELAGAGPRSGAALAIRVGVHTGEAIIGAIAGREDRGITAIGDTVNLASRIQEACAPGAVWVTRVTRDLARGEFRFRELQSITVKGKPDPIPVFELEGTRGRSTTRRLFPTRFVGREAHSGRLQSHLDATARRGRMGAAVIVGEPGIGKTRFLREFRRSLADVTVWWSEVDSHPAGPYAPFLRMLRDRYAAGESGPADAAWRTVADGVLAEFGPEVARELDAALVGLAAPGGNAGDEVDPVEHRERVRHAFSRLFRAAARRRPILLCLDNLHGADSSSVELAVHLIEVGREDPLFLLCSSRPERNERIARLRDLGAMVLPLEPLSAEAGLSIVADVAREAGLGERVRVQMVERSGGNPLFLEELVRAFVQGAAGAVPIPDELPAEIPGTLYSALAARIDTLAPREKQVLQMASVVGRVFWRDILAHLAGGEIDPVLVRLEEQGLVHREDVYRFNPGEEFVFRHALVHEVVYGTLLKKTRKDLHRWVADRLTQDRPLETLEVVGLAAHHYRAAGAHAEAAKLYARAGELSLQARADEEAAEYFARAHESVDALAAEPDAPAAVDLDATRAGLAAKRASVLSRLGRYEDALGALDLVDRSAAVRGDADLAADAAADRARIFGFQGRFAEALELAHRGIEHWRGRNRADRLGHAHFLESEICFLAGRLESVFMALKHAQDLYDRTGDAAGKARCLFQLGFVLAARGFHDQAYKVVEQSLATATDPDSARSLLAHGKLALLLAERGDLDGALANLGATVAACAQRGLRRTESANRISLAALLVRKGRTAEARAELDRALPLKSRMGDRRGRALALLNLAEAWQADGEYGRALRGFAQALEEGRAASDLSVEAKVKLAEARARAEIADRARAEARFGEAIDTAKGSGLRFEEGLAIVGRSGCGAGGMFASLQIGKAETVAREIGSRALAVEVQLARAETALVRGDLAGAERPAQEAHAAAGGCGRPALALRAGIALLRATPSPAAELRDSLQAAARDLHRPILDLELDAALARIAEREGRRAEAQERRERAATLARRMADACDDAALAKAFLGSDRLHALLGR